MAKAVKVTDNIQEDFGGDLVTITKDGETLRAHPTQLALWIEQGWSVVE